MSEYRRKYVAGGTYFFTCVTHARRRFLTSDLARQCLHDAIAKIRQNYPFEIIAQVLLPDHWHSIWQLPEGDDRYPLRWMRIKEEFTRHWLAGGGAEFAQSESRGKHRYRGVWQKRYWEHSVRSQQDLKRCVDYIHWNPRKHSLVESVSEWPWSTFHQYVVAGDYEPHWGGRDPVPNWNAPEWGE